MFGDNATISAISTASSPAGIGIVRLSGSTAVEIANRMFVSRSGADIASPSNDRRVLYGRVNDDDGSPIDECLCIVMRGPRSYTGEDVVEFQCHGSAGALRAVLARTMRLGARLAEPGEFTRRALLSGRIDLTQAEAVNEVIRARTTTAAKLAARQLEGNLGLVARSLSEEALSLLARIEASIDFPDDVLEVPIDELISSLASLGDSLERLLAGFRRGQLYRRGASVAIVGRPNVGKSSLLNALLGRDRAIVTPCAGTTRDVIEEEVDFDGVAVRLMDTAGLREAENEAEVEGVVRARKAAEVADAVILVVDGTAPLSEEDYEASQAARGKPMVIAVNKADLKSVVDAAEATRMLEAAAVSISAVSGEGLDSLRSMVYEVITKAHGVAAEEPYMATQRQMEAVEAARGSLQKASTALTEGFPVDMACVYIRDAVDSLGRLTGQTVDTGVLDAIFDGFCVGK